MARPRVDGPARGAENAPGPENWRTSYPAFLAGMVVISVISYFLLRRIEARGTDRPE